jgi:uncharacterized membrane protein YoaK (UPF0700 family)
VRSGRPPRRRGFDLGALRREAAASFRHPLARTLLLLTFTAGLIDAVSYLALGHVFTANMTGNVVFLGFGIARSRAVAGAILVRVSAALPLALAAALALLGVGGYRAAGDGWTGQATSS